MPLICSPLRTVLPLASRPYQSRRLSTEGMRRRLEPMQPVDEHSDLVWSIALSRDHWPPMTTATYVPVAVNYGAAYVPATVNNAQQIHEPRKG